MARWRQVVLWTAAIAGCWGANAGVATYALAQYPRAQKPTKRSYTDKGMITAVAAGALGVMAEREKKLWLIRPDPACLVEVTGEAEADYLKSGMIVRLRGQFDKRYQSVAPVKHLEIVSPLTPNLAAGIFPDALADADEAGEDKNADAGQNQDDDGDEDDKQEANKKKSSDDAGSPLMIVGRLRVVKDNKLLVAAGNRTVRAELADDAEIRVSLSDYTLAQPGDAVKFRTYYFQKGAAFATELTIELTNPLTAPKKGARRPVRKASRSNE